MVKNGPFRPAPSAGRYLQKKKKKNVLHISPKKFCKSDRWMSIKSQSPPSSWNFEMNMYTNM